MTEEGTLRIVLIATAGLLLLCATVLAGRVAFGSLRSKQLETTAIRLMQDDLDCAFLTDAMGQVRYANTVAVMRFGDCTGRRLADLFGSFLANPHPFLQRLSHGAHLTGASKEDVITRSGHFRLSVVVISPALRLWRRASTTPCRCPC